MKRNLSVLILFIIFLTSCDFSANTIKDKYRDFYEIFVRSFYDSNGDKIGDIKGITEKLDYLNDGKKAGDDLGITGIYLMPIMPSPSYHKYDVTDYYAIDPEYGTMADFEEFIAESHKRGISVIADLVLNHTSAQHPWFISAKKSIAIEPCGQETCIYPELCREHNQYCSFYNFSTDPFRKTEVDMPSGWYYEAVFWDQMPDLNLSNEFLREEIKKITKFWLDKGVDGFRLDAVTHFYENKLMDNIAFLDWFSEMAIEEKENAYIVGEAWSNQLTILNYYRSSIDSYFNFPFAENGGFIKQLISRKDGVNLSKQIEKWQNMMLERSPNAIDAPFLSNHDNDRSIDYFSDNSEAKLAASVYLLMPGNPFIYYGEEIGMTGKGRDENKRQPLVWSVKDKTGIASPAIGTEQTQNLSAGVKEQLTDPDSLLYHYRNILKIKSEYPEIARGKIKAIDTGVKEICLYSLEYKGSVVYIIHNFSDESIEIPYTGEINAKKIAGALYTSGGESKINGNNITLAKKSTLVLK